MIKPDDYIGAAIAPIQAFAAPVMGHMNEDHSEATVAMVQHYIGLPQVEKAELVQLDRLGFMVQITRQGQTFKLRLPFPRAADDRKDVKNLIVEMTRTSMSNPEVQAAMEVWLLSTRAATAHCTWRAGAATRLSSRCCCRRARRRRSCPLRGRRRSTPPPSALRVCRR